MRPTLILGEAATGLRRNLTMTVAAVLVVSIALGLLGVAMLIRQTINKNKDYWYDRVEVSLFLCSDGDTEPSCSGGAVTDAQREQIQTDLKNLPQVQAVYYESKEQAYQLFLEDFADTDLADNITADQLPEAFRVKLVNPETDYVIVASAFEGRPGVQSVADQRKLFEDIFSILNVFRVGSLVIAGIALAATVLLIVVVIRVAAFSRRRETSIMRLVGASNLSIQLPFLAEGAFAGLVGGLLAMVYLLAGKALFVDVLADKVKFFEYVSWSETLVTSATLVAVGVVVSIVISYLTLLKYLRV
jgi:cell division transport system permease protein